MVYQWKGKDCFIHLPPKVPQTARPKAMLPDPPKEDQDPMAQPLKVTDWDQQASQPQNRYCT